MIAQVQKLDDALTISCDHAPTYSKGSRNDLYLQEHPSFDPVRTMGDSGVALTKLARYSNRKAIANGSCTSISVLSSGLSEDVLCLRTQYCIEFTQSTLLVHLLALPRRVARLQLALQAGQGSPVCWNHA